MPRRAHTPPDIPPPDVPPPATPAGAACDSDLVAGDPPVPITVWRTPGGDGQASVPSRLAERLVSAYSRPGEVVIDLTDDHALSGAADVGGRRHHTAWFTDASTLIVGPPTGPSTSPSTVSAQAGRGDRPDRPPGRRRRQDIEPPELAAWFGDDLTDPHLPPPGPVTGGGPTANPDSTAANTVAGTVRGATSLLVACWPLHAAGARNRTRLRWLLHAAVALLRPGGCLVLVVRRQADAPGSPQDHGPLVDAAHDAGLGYLQHIVAVRADVDGDRFTYYATDAELQALAARGELAVAHLPVHADLLVFTPRPLAQRAGSGAGGGGARG